MRGVGKALFATIVTLAAWPAAGQVRAPKALDGNVIEVVSGDTVYLVADGAKYKIRLFGVDAPEKDQPYFDDAIRVLSGRVLSREVHVDLRGGDRKEGYWALMTQGGQSVNKAMVDLGAAWHNAEQANSKALAAAQEKAKQSKLGLWASDEAPVPPWKFREKLPKASDLAAERLKTREEEAGKAAAAFLKAWQAGAAPAELLTEKGQSAADEKKKAPGGLAGVEIKPGKVNLRGNTAEVLMTLAKGDLKIRGKVQLKSESKKWLVRSVEIANPPAILDFENIQSTVDKISSALDEGLKPRDGAPAGEGELPAQEAAEELGGGRGGKGGLGQALPAEDSAAVEEMPEEPTEAAESPPETAPEPQPAVAAEAVAPPAGKGAPRRRGGLGAKLQSPPEAEEAVAEEADAEAEAQPPMPETQRHAVDESAPAPLSPPAAKGGPVRRGGIGAKLRQPSSDAATADGVVKLLPNWKVGEKKRVEVISEQFGAKDGKEGLLASTHSVAEIEVLEASPDGYVVAWTERQIRPTAKLVQPELTALVGVPVKLALDSEGRIQGLRDWEPVAEALQKWFETGLSRAKEQSPETVDEEKLQEARAKFQERYGTEEALAFHFREEIGEFFALYGREASEAGVVADDQMPVPGGETLACKTRTTLKPAAEDGKTEIHLAFEVDKDAFTEKVRELLSKKEGSETRPEAVTVDVVKSERRVVADLESGWPASVEAEYEISGAPISLKEKTRYRVREPKTLTANTPIPADAVTLAPRWKVGDRKKIELTSTRHNVKGDEETLVQEVARVTELEVKEAIDNGYVLVWTDQEDKVVSGQAKLDPSIAAMLNHPITLELGPQGQLVAIRNWEEVRDRTVEAFQAIIDENPATPPAALELIRRVVDKPAGVLVEFTKGKGDYFALMGKPVSTTQEIVVDDGFLLPYVESPVPCKARLKARQSDRGAPYLEVECVHEFDPDQVSVAFAAVTKTLMEVMGSKEAPPAEVPVDIEESMRCLVNTETGWMPEFDLTRRIVGGGQSFVDRLKVRMVESDNAEAEPEAESPPLRNPKFRGR